MLLPDVPFGSFTVLPYCGTEVWRYDDASIGGLEPTPIPSLVRILIRILIYNP